MSDVNSSVSDSPTAPGDSPGKAVQAVPIERIRPGRQQARRHFDRNALEELASSIAQSGVIQPVVLRPVGGDYELLAGERRWRASQIAGLDVVPAIIRNDLSEREATVLGLIENLQRESLSPTETAEGLKKLGEAFALTHDQIAARVGKSRVYVTNFLRVLKLEFYARELLDSGQLSLGHAKVLAGVSADRQRALAAETVRQALSVRALERRCAKEHVAAPSRSANVDLQALENALTDLLGNRVHVHYREATGRGSLQIDFTDLQELQGVLDRLGYRND